MTVFILGAGLMQVPAIRIAKELGWRVALADANDKAFAVGMADRFLHVDLKDRIGLEAAARSLKSEIGLDGVFTAGTDFSASVAWVAERLDLPGIPYEAALRASDKVRMREAFASAGVPSPRFVSVLAPGKQGKTGPDIAEVPESLGFPLVVKPADNMGARGCRAVRDKAELEAAVTEAMAFSRSGRVIVEEYIEGPEFSVDALVDNEGIRIRGLADRHIRFFPYFVELGHTMPTSCKPEIAAELLRVFELGVKAIGIERGAAKGDIKYCPSRGCAVVGEIAARLSGGYMSGWTYPYASGIDVTREALFAAVGLAGAEQERDRGWVSAERAFISLPGKVSSLIGSLEAERMPYVKNLFLRAEAGDSVVFPVNNVEKCGNVISQAPDRETAVEAAEGAVRAILLRLSPNEKATEDFLCGSSLIRNPDGSMWPPAAFEPGTEIQAKLDAMPEFFHRHSPGKRIVVVPFEDAEMVEGLDWAGRSFADSAELALELGGAEFGMKGDIVLGGRFWRALARGGAQAALYVLDSEAAPGSRIAKP